MKKIFTLFVVLIIVITSMPVFALSESKDNHIKPDEFMFAYNTVFFKVFRANQQFNSW